MTRYSMQAIERKGELVGKGYIDDCLRLAEKTDGDAVWIGDAEVAEIRKTWNAVWAEKVKAIGRTDTCKSCGET